MFYPNDFTIRKIKEQEINEWVQQAATDRLAKEVCSHRLGTIVQLPHALMHQIGHFCLVVGNQLDQLSTRKPPMMHPSAHR